MSDCDYDTETSSVLSDNSSDELLTTFDELIQRAEVLNNTIKVSFQALEYIKEQIDSHNTIMINNKDFGEILDELREKAKESNSACFGDMLLNMLEMGIIHE